MCTHSINRTALSPKGTLLYMRGDGEEGAGGMGGADGGKGGAGDGEGGAGGGIGGSGDRGEWQVREWQVVLREASDCEGV